MGSAKGYFWICLEEQGMTYKDLLSKGGGAGFSGAGYSVLRKVTGGRTREWCRTHPWKCNELLAAYYCGPYIQSSPARWHSNPNPQNNRDYTDKVALIAWFCERTAQGFTTEVPGL